MLNRYVMALFFTFLCGLTARAGTLCGPVLDLNEYWKTNKNAQTIDCTFKYCFPKTLDSPISCDSRCLFTKNGDGTPEAQSRAFAGKKRPLKSVVPKFMVAYGPPASGKSEILRVLQQKINDEFKDLNDTTIAVNVDDIFQRGSTGESYQIYRKNILEKYGKKAGLYTQRLYATFRWVGDQISDAILNQALAARYNILWETTGASTWPMQEINRVNNYDYNTIVVYPVVAADDLIQRASLRAQNEGQEAAPEASIRATVESAQQNLIGLLPAQPGLDQLRPPCDLTKITESSNEHACRAKQVIIIDNTGAKGEEKIAFDSKNPATYCASMKSLNEKAKINKKLLSAISFFMPRCALGI